MNFRFWDLFLHSPRRTGNKARFDKFLRGGVGNQGAHTKGVGRTLREGEFLPFRYLLQPPSENAL